MSPATEPLGTVAGKRGIPKLGDPKEAVDGIHLKWTKDAKGTRVKARGKQWQQYGVVA